MNELPSVGTVYNVNNHHYEVVVTVFLQEQSWESRMPLTSISEVIIPDQVVFGWQGGNGFLDTLTQSYQPTGLVLTTQQMQNAARRGLEALTGRSLSPDIAATIRRDYGRTYDSLQQREEEKIHTS